MRPEHLAIIALGLVVGFVLGWWLRRRGEIQAMEAVAQRVRKAAAGSAPAPVAAEPAGATSVEANARKAALAAIAALDLPMGRERGLQLASIARRFLTDAYAIPAMTCTTAELNELVRRHDLFDDHWRGVLDSLDAVRFGGPAAITELEKHLRAVLDR